MASLDDNLYITLAWLHWHRAMRFKAFVGWWCECRESNPGLKLGKLGC